MEERILEYLRASASHVSGEELSHKLGITRSAIWKNIHSLIDQGYEIIAVPHLGYKLVSLTHKLLPREIQHNLKTKFIGKQIFYFDSLTSTMDNAMELGLDSCPEGSLVVAETQTKGRGRLGRQWLSPKYKGLYFSLLLRPKIIPQRASVLTIVIAVSVAEAVQKITGLALSIKWPNDIIFANKKLGGILVEMNAEMDMVRFVVVGAGINVSKGSSQLVNSATSLEEELGYPVERVLLLQEILRSIEANYIEFCISGAKSILERWKKLASTLHSRIKVHCHKQYIEGEAVDIDLDGGLLIRNDSGFIEKVMAGDVVSLKRL